MINNNENLLNYDEEEDVVIAGSELDEVLSKMGYTDYEIVSQIDDKQSPDKTNEKPAPKNSFSTRRLEEKVSQIYRYLTKDNRAAKEQLLLISEAEHLLDDHSALIKSILEDDGQTQFRGKEKFLTYLRYAAEASAFLCFVDRPNSVTSLLVLPLMITAHRKYKNYRTNRYVKKLMHEQTELYYNYKKIFRILKQFFGAKRTAKQSGITKFVDLSTEKLKFLQPVTENTLKSLQSLSAIYYQTTLIFANNLPDNYRRIIDPQITRFDSGAFLNCGEITYETLKKLFYRFILIQSEMLVTFSVFSISEPRSIFDGIKRTVLTENRIEILVESTNRYRLLIEKLVNDFHNYKSAVIEPKYRGFRGSKWQDLYVRLYLTSHKIQNAQNTLSSVLEEIENHLDRGTDEAKLLERLKISIDEVYGDAEKARDLAQLSGLIVLKMERANVGKEDKESELNDEVSVENSRLDIPVIRNSDPEIVDEVFEEYIRERYSDKLFNEEGDDYFENCNHKLDKLISINLMSELKEALVDKERDTKERESRALERMGNKNAIEIATNDQAIENFSPDNKADIELKNSLQLSANYSEETDIRKLYPVPIPPPMPMKRDLNQQIAKEKYESTAVEKKNEIVHEKSNCFIPLNNSFPLSESFFLSNSEETFIGSGENSEEDDESPELDTE